MLDRADALLEDMQDADALGCYLCTVSNHYSRILAVLSPDDRVRLLHAAYHWSTDAANPASPSPFQFVAYSLLFAEPRHYEQWDTGPAAIQPDDLDAQERVSVDTVLKGESPRLLASLLNDILYSEFLNVDRFLDCEPDTFEDPSTRTQCIDVHKMRNGSRIIIPSILLNPAQAAAMIAAVDYNARNVDRFEASAGNLLSEARFFPSEACASHHPAHLQHVADQFERTAASSRPAQAVHQQDVFVRQPVLQKFSFQERPTGLLIPARQTVLVAKTLQEAVTRARQDREAVLAMNPRQFEKFVHYLLSSLGFEVALTKCTRDGGVDLVCTNALHGVPFRLAIEIKRYQDRPIDVGLVRSFVGANEQFKANRLLYVTTSRYTAPACQYADKYVSHFLTLAQYDQIQQWCDEVQSLIPALL